MHSQLPKVMHLLTGEPILSHVIRTAQSLLHDRDGRITVVTGHGREVVDPFVESMGCTLAHQDQQLGTGHAVSIALEGAPPESQTLVLYGDVPLVTSDQLRPLLMEGRDRLAVMTALVSDPTGYGRIVRSGDQSVVAIVEQRDATDTELSIREINSGIYAAPTSLFQQLLPKITSANAQGEYYLTDCVALAVREGGTVGGVQGPEEAVMGVNDKVQLAAMEQRVQSDRRYALMRDGVTLQDPNSVYLAGDVSIASDVIIEPNVTLIGPIRIETGVRISFGCHLTDVEIGEAALLKPYSVLEKTTVGARAQVGPFARLRPGTELAPDTHIGNFVETKNAQIGEGSKINHLSYIGDATIGMATNVGAGTITCNYDGANKHRTVLGDRVFVGSNSSLVAPITVGDDATLGAGSVITRNVDPAALALTRAPQKTIPSYPRPKKAKE